MIRLPEIRSKLKELGDAKRAEFALHYFKTGPGQYGESQKFLGIPAAPLHKLSRDFQDASLKILESLLHSDWHEERSLALLILVRQYQKGDENRRKKIYEFYRKNLKYVNSWDHVDASAEHILGAYLRNRHRGLLRKLAKSKSLWSRRVAILSTFHYIKQGDFSETFEIAAILLNDREDLIHKAVGWMLREVGKRNRAAEEAFLKQNYRQMPRTMLRYAIEKFPESIRQKYLRGLI